MTPLAEQICFTNQGENSRIIVEPLNHPPYSLDLIESVNIDFRKQLFFREVQFGRVKEMGEVSEDTI